MFEAHIVTHANRHLYEEEWDQFLRLRHNHFVDEKRWREPSPDGREVDQFDTKAATYLLGMDEGEVVASARLIRGSDANMVSDVFPHLCNARPVPRSDDWADWTRSFIIPRKRSFGVKGTAGAMACAVMEYCLAEDIRYVGGIQTLYFLSAWDSLGWTVVPLGTPEKVDDKWCLVAYVECTAPALASGRAYCGAPTGLLRNRAFDPRHNLPTGQHLPEVRGLLQ